VTRIECAVLGCGTAVDRDGDLCGECQRKAPIDPSVIAPEGEA